WRPPLTSKEVEHIPNNLSGLKNILLNEDSLRKRHEKYASGGFPKQTCFEDFVLVCRYAAYIASLYAPELDVLFDIVQVRGCRGCSLLEHEISEITLLLEQG